MDGPRQLALMGVDPPLRTDLPRLDELPEAPVIYVRGDSISFRGHDGMTNLDLAEALSKLVPASGPASLYVVADAHTTVEQVSSALFAAHLATFDDVSFVFRRPPSTERPRHTRVDKELEPALAASDHPNELAALYTAKLIAPCPALVTAFADPDRIHRIGPALAACKCAVDPYEVQSLFWQVQGNPDPISVLDVHLDVSVPNFDMPADTLWSTANAQLTPQTKRIWLWPRTT
jgi:hypothetical protein